MLKHLIKIVCLIIFVVTLIASPAMADPPPVQTNGNGCHYRVIQEEDSGLECSAGAYVTAASDPGVFVYYCDLWWSCEYYDKDLVWIYRHCDSSGCYDPII